MRPLTTVSLAFIIFSVVSCSTSKKTSDSVRDGSSYERAVMVKSIIEEYEYVKKACPKCQLLGQTLSHYKDKPYDILRLRTTDGEEVAYYFDISKFFGKGF